MLLLLLAADGRTLLVIAHLPLHALRPSCWIGLAVRQPAKLVQLLRSLPNRPGRFATAWPLGFLSRP
jgi:hypothetical protein